MPTKIFNDKQKQKDVVNTYAHFWAFAFANETPAANYLISFVVEL